MQNENSSRKRILERMGKALAKPRLPSLHRHDRPVGQIFPAITDALERLRKECAANSTEYRLTSDPRASAAAIRDILASLPAGQTFVQDAPELRVMSTEWARVPLRWSSEGPPAEASQATITLAHILVAETGSIFVSAACGGRAASVIAPVHIVVAHIGQLVPTLEAGFERLQDQSLEANNSYVCLITGSSRTADIEKMLVLGAHGPRRLVLVMAQSDE